MIGNTISHYQILAQLGAGGMGVVYKAYDARLKREVAIKFLSPDISRQEQKRDGPDLKRKVISDQLSVDSVIDIAIQIAEGLQAAHEKGITHRDVKPANIMLPSKGQVKITDFGLAKIAQASLSTKAGMTLGTVAYMSPEQARGEETDCRTDIFGRSALCSTKCSRVSCPSAANMIRRSSTRF